MATFADYLAAGKGAVEFRLVIEGCPFEFVSEQRMEGSLGDGRSRVRGLIKSGLQISESVYMADATHNVNIASVQIAETDGPYRDAATSTFTGFSAASTVTWLWSGSRTTVATTVYPADTTIAVQSGAGVTLNQYLHLGTEVVQVTGIALSGNVDVADVLTVTRGLWRTTAQGFAPTAQSMIGTEPIMFALTTQPMCYAGRRVWLYGHGTDELDTGSTGTLLFRGMVSENPELTDSRTWSISIQPRTKLLDCDIGFGTQGSAHLRGIYYSAQAPLRIDFRLSADATHDGATSASYSMTFTGFYETQQEFCAALQDAINAATPGSWGTWSAGVTPPMLLSSGSYTPETWDLYYTTPSSSPGYVNLSWGSPIDGWFSGDLWPSTTLPSGIGSGPTQTVAASTRYWCAWTANNYGGHTPLPPWAPSLRAVPRACYQGWMPLLVPADDVTWPLTRMYLDQSLPFIEWGTCKLTPPYDASGGATAPDPYEFTASVNSVLGWVAPSGAAARGTHFPLFTVAGTWQPSIELTAAYGNRAGDTVAGFMTAIVSASIAPTGGNGGGPFILGDDVADWTTEVNTAASGSWHLLQRIYSFTKKVKLLDVLKEELKLYGLYMCLDSDSKIAVKRYPTDLATPSTTIDQSVHLVDDDFGGMKLSPDGIVSGVTIKDDYQPADDKWNLTLQFRNLQAQAAAKAKSTPITIAPMVRVATPTAPSGRGIIIGTISLADADAIAKHIMAFFGTQYYIVSIPVAITMHTLHVGDAVLVTIPQLPHAGQRGATTAGSGFYQTVAYVVGRTWKYGDQPGGTLDLFVHGLNLAGYAPSALLSSASGSGTVWTLTMSATFFGNGTVHDASYFASGFKVVMRHSDSETPQRYTGTVSSVSGDVITAIFDIAWPGPGADATAWVLGFDCAQVVTTAQQKYAYLADPMGRIQFSPTANARQFA